MISYLIRIAFLSPFYPRQVPRDSVHDSASFLLFYCSPQWLGIVLLVNPHLLTYGEEVKHKVVEVQTGRETVEQQRQKNGHKPYHHLLTGIFNRHSLLHVHGDTHQQSQATYVFDSEQRQVEW